MPKNTVGNREATQPTQTMMTTRSRKIQPDLREKAENYLARANVSDLSSSCQKSAPKARKRKLQDVVDAEKHQSLNSTRALETNTSVFASVPKLTGKPSEKASRALKPKKDKLSQLKDAPESDLDRPLSVPEAVKKSSKPESPKEPDEKRLKRYRKQAPQSFLQKLHRAQTQRMVVLKRTRSDTEAFPKEDVELVGSTGNIYTVTIGQIPSCTCPDYQKGNECKHKVYVLCTVLKAPEHLQYQLAFLSSELRDIFAAAPAIPTDVSSAGDTDGKRKPVEGECPICYTDFDEANNQLVWCKAACGNNMHKSCFDEWAASQSNVGVRCVYCRTPWHVDPGDLDEVKKAGSVGVDGYVNVGQQFGMSQARDYSTYHPFWVRRHLGNGW